MIQYVGACPIWGDPYDAKGIYKDSNRTFQISSSLRAGGGYQIDEVLLNSSVLPLAIEEKARLTTWIINQRMQGVWMPEITEVVIEHVKARRSLSVNERADRLLTYIERRATTVSTSVAIEEGTYAAYAWSESTEWNEIFYFLNYLRDTELIQGDRSADGSFWGNLTVDGYTRIEDRRTSVDTSQAFVAMWFDDSMNEAYEKGIEPAIVEAGYKPLRIDRKEHVNKVDDEIIAGLRRSRFVVADSTHGKDGARGGVYYEAGFAHGLGLQVIFTCRKDAMGKVHFDTNHYNHIDWTDPADLRKRLKNRILRVIGEGPEARKS